MQANRPLWLVSSGHETTAPEQKWSEFLLRVNPRGREQRGRSPKATARKPVITILAEDPAVLIAITGSNYPASAADSAWIIPGGLVPVLRARRTC
ncbi:MAG: hypothetical protein AN484_26855 [Aphanizomenon flos-aquae WA102]|uniref:Uncharacterized protein n=1 Tax=Aphanizomenon flos-aquae WA102 TaxID=1710896 RepID=A0A1B7WAC3_APHFL|nr:MAG: hypothetical protein AN484_26855 [Aphanizomenon flos-aquae WA102]